jgi:hypothetical protein
MFWHGPKMPQRPMVSDISRYLVARVLTTANLRCLNLPGVVETYINNLASSSDKVTIGNFAKDQIKGKLADDWNKACVFALRFHRHVSVYPTDRCPRHIVQHQG